MTTGILSSNITKDLGKWKTYSKQDKIMITGILCSALLSFYVIYVYMNDSTIWSTDLATDEEVNRRQKSRGMVTSIITSFFSVSISFIMIVGMKSNSAIYQVLVSIICIGLIGFILDNAFATENGVRVLLHGIDPDNPDTDKGISFKKVNSALKYSYGSLISSKIPRYFIVSMLDIFISLMLTDSIVWALVNKFRIHRSISDIFAMIVVAITTFLAYSNATRLEWAYPAVEDFHERSSLISTPTILISTIIASMVFSNWEPKSSKATGITSPEGKLIMIMVLFGLIIVSYYAGFLEPILKNEIKNEIIPCPSDESAQCVQTFVETNDIPTVKDTYDMGVYGVIAFFILCIICTIAVLYSSSLPNKSSNNISLTILVIGIMTFPGIISFMG
jgi:hypothetical protein